MDETVLGMALSTLCSPQIGCEQLCSRKYSYKPPVMPQHMQGILSISHYGW